MGGTERKNAVSVPLPPYRAVLDVRRGALSEQNNRMQGGSGQRSIYTGFDTPHDIVKERTLAVVPCVGTYSMCKSSRPVGHARMRGDEDSVPSTAASRRVVLERRRQ